MINEKEKQFVRTLEKEAEAAEKSEGVMIKDLPPGQILAIKTKNSTYRIIVLNSAEGLVQLSGGNTEKITGQKEVEATVSGSTWGGSAMKAGFLGVGMSIEFALGKGRIMTTSPVKKISVVIYTPVSDKVH